MIGTSKLLGVTFAASKLVHGVSRLLIGELTLHKSCSTTECDLGRRPGDRVDLPTHISSLYAVRYPISSLDTVVVTQK